MHRILTLFAEANPDSTPEFRAQFLTQLAPPDVSGSGSDSVSDMRKTAERLEGLDVSSAVSSLRSMRVADSLRRAASVDRKAALKGLLGVLEGMPDEDKAVVLSTIRGRS